jgi:hypothetical protein
MTSPFPGMDPYLENPSGWETVHHWIISVLAERLGQVLPEWYWVAIERRTYLPEPEDLMLVGRPDASVVGSGALRESRSGAATLVSCVEVAVPMPNVIREGYLEIRDPQSGEVVTAIEVLSPSNKLPGSGRREYLRKRERVLSSDTNLVEIDLLREGARMPADGAPGDYDYGVLVSRGETRPHASLHPVTVREPLPTVPLPLRPGEPEVVVDLAAVLGTVYERGRFDRIVDYAREPDPPLAASDREWARALLQRLGHGGADG